MEYADQEMPDFSGKGLKILISCPFCHTPYHSFSRKIIEENEEAHLFHLECVKCGSQVLALETTDWPTPVSVGLITELKSSEVKKFQNGPAVEINDLIDLHFILKNNEQLLLVER